MLPARVVVYLVLAGCLFAELGYGQVWQKLTAGLTGLDLTEPASGTLREARQRLGSTPLRALFDLLRGPAVTTATHAVRWRGLLVTAIDGTTMSVADAEAVRVRYRKQRGNHGGAGYPALRLSVLLTCGTRSIIDAVFAPLGTSELDQARSLARSLAAGMLLLADRNYAAADLAAAVWRRWRVGRSVLVAAGAVLVAAGVLLVGAVVPHPDTRRHQGRPADPLQERPPPAGDPPVPRRILAVDHRHGTGAGRRR
ncbi:transposase domain-containing protein [Solwaraspora sp. WMMA2056]|uniref:transposase domain-containing protein n=1 Tax=Solwaraspora sp. WMMA2056 TaxID=3015161 RepID=UPI00259BC4FD|nr:transposase domain-containing protein [Solwaraspora sp. WMMA2056]WJK43805.1 transposase domain-containing protein [Solwaraspora sp. WMMA2056]